MSSVEWVGKWLLSLNKANVCNFFVYLCPDNTSGNLIAILNRSFSFEGREKYYSLTQIQMLRSLSISKSYQEKFL